jgi:FAD synthase
MLIIDGLKMGEHNGQGGVALVLMMDRRMRLGKAPLIAGKVMQVSALGCGFEFSTMVVALTAYTSSQVGVFNADLSYQRKRTHSKSNVLP